MTWGEGGGGVLDQYNIFYLHFEELETLTLLRTKIYFLKYIPSLRQHPLLLCLR